MLNNYGKYNACEERVRLAELVQRLEDEPAMKKEKLIVKIEYHPGFYSADCPKCGKIKILSSELNTLTAVCDKCYYSFLLEK